MQYIGDDISVGGGLYTILSTRVMDRDPDPGNLVPFELFIDHSYKKNNDI